MGHIALAVTAPRRAGLSPAVLFHHVVNLAPMVLVHVGSLAVFFTDGPWWEWAVLPVLLYFRGLFVTRGYHRYFSHRSFKTSRVFQFVMAFFCCANLQQGPLWWALHHRHHHRHSDDPGDVHSPYQGGFLWAYCGWLIVPFDPPWERGEGEVVAF
jgi:stearoyl-CoA desaturase (delta-9 desaturase)